MAETVKGSIVSVLELKGTTVDTNYSRCYNGYIEKRWNKGVGY